MLERQADAHAAGLATRVDEDPAGGADAAEADGVRDRHLQLRDRVVRPVQEYHGRAGVRLEQAGLDELVTEGHGAGRAGENGRRDRQATLLRTPAAGEAPRVPALGAPPVQLTGVEAVSDGGAAASRFVAGKCGAAVGEGTDRGCF